MGLDTIELVLRVALVIDALALIALIMVQQGKGASMGAAFGSGASQTMFGSAGAASFLTRLTTWLAVVFFALCFGLAWAARERAQSAGTIGIPSLDAAAEAAQEAPVLDFDLPTDVPTDVPTGVPMGMPTDDFDPLPSDEDVPTLDAAPSPADEVPTLPEGG